MPFIKGQSGNPLGRARKPNIYTSFKEKYFSKKPKSNNKIMGHIYAAAEDGEVWAIQLWAKMYIPSATIQIDSTSREISEKRVLVSNLLSGMSAEEKRNLYDLITRKKPIDNPVNLIESPVKCTQEDNGN